jgi:serine/threonine protein kinase
MADHLNEQMEPLPGYRLLERLGSGGFGEVWKTTAPGGLLKAMKFVHGALDLQKGSAAQEFKSLQRIKDLHHPFLLSLERIDIIDDQLVIVMELADRNLQDRLVECQGQGLPGIPREELLRYMAEAAEALDLLNQEHQIQHMDIKPQNLFLIRKHIKVADFGLAKDLEGTQATLSSGITPTYAAPETFESVVSHHCDQYSLAIVYQELLTGQRPFNGKNARQLLLQHVSMPPDVSALPEADRPIVARALAKKPGERFPTCLEFVRALPRQAELPVAEAAPVEETVPAAPQQATSSPALTAEAEVNEEMPASAASSTETPKRRPADRPPRTKKKKASQPKDEAKVACPRCGAPAPDGKAFEFCPACGFVPGLDTQEKKGLWRLLPRVPWYWVLGTGIVTIIGMAVAGHLTLPGESETRAVWGLGQCAAGVVLLFVAQLWAVVMVATEVAGIGIREVIMPTIRVWWATIQRLPVTRWPIYLSVWGLLFAACGLFVGDMMYWNRLQAAQKARQEAPRATVSPVEQEARKEERRTIAVIEERVRQLPPPLPAPEGETKPTVQCVAIGYVPTEDGSSIRGVLMATVRDGKLVQTDVVDQGFSTEDRSDLLRRFQKLERSYPPSWWKGSAPEGIVWVNADSRKAVVCEVECKKVDEKDGRPIEPRYKRLLREEP